MEISLRYPLTFLCSLFLLQACKIVFVAIIYILVFVKFLIFFLYESSLCFPYDSLTDNYVQRRRRFRRGSLGTQSTLSLLRKELRESNSQALLGGWSHSGALPSAAPDPLLSSLIYTLPVTNSSNDMMPEPPDEGVLASERSEKKAVERFETFSY